MTKYLTCVRGLTLAALIAAHTVQAQKPATDDQRRSDAANEPLQAGAAAQRDAAAIRDAKTGWFAEALKTRDGRLAWWRDARPLFHMKNNNFVHKNQRIGIDLEKRSA